KPIESETDLPGKSTQPPVTTDSGSQEQETPKRTDIVFGFNTEPDSLVPTTTASLSTICIIQNMFDGLVRLNSETKVVEPLLAETWEISDDGLTYTFQIKQNVLFHNGDVLTTDDVVGSLKLAKESAVTQDVLAPVESIEKGENNTVVLKCSSAPNNMFLYNLAQAGKFGILDMKLYDEVGLSGYQENPVGTGPYTYVSWEKGVSVKMIAFEDYHMGAAPIKDITFRIIVDPATTTMALESGEIDISGNIALTELDSVDMSHLSLYQGSGDSITYLFLNTQNQYLQDVRVRQAISMLVNKQDILAVIAGNLGIVADSLYRDGTDGYDASVGDLGYDPEKAKALLAEAGCADGFEINYKTNEGDGASIGQILQDSLKDANITVNIEVMETNAYIQDCFAGNFDIGFMIYNPGHLKPLLAAKLLASDSAINFGKFVNQDLDAYLTSAMYDRDEAYVRGVVPKIQEIIRDQVPVIPLFWQDVVVLVNADLKGLTNVSMNYPYYLSW
ncbi:MAG TPA: ABC transporter substrate-binding protein, partial [Clostridia bacterium]|nr:ABC transporter substrate-binding protein [Clostridia bacterium]